MIDKGSGRHIGFHIAFVHFISNLGFAASINENNKSNATLISVTENDKI